MNLSEQFEKFDIPKEYTHSWSTLKFLMLFIVLGVAITLPSYVSLFGLRKGDYGMSVIILLIGIPLVLTILNMLGLGFKKANQTTEFKKSKSELNSAKKEILNQISQAKNLSSFYPFLTLNLSANKKVPQKINGENTFIYSEKESDIYKNKDAIELLEEIKQTIVTNKIYPKIDQENIYEVLEHYSGYLGMTPENGEILGLQDLKTTEVFPKLEEVQNFLASHEFSFDEFLQIREFILSNYSLEVLFYETLTTRNLLQKGASYIQEDINKYIQYIKTVSNKTLANGDMTIEIQYAIIPLKEVLLSNPELFTNENLEELYKYQVDWSQLEILLNNENFNHLDKNRLIGIFYWDRDSLINVIEVVNNCSNENTLIALREISSNTSALIKSIASHRFNKDFDFSAIFNAIINKHWNNLYSLKDLLCDKLSQDLDDTTYRDLTARISQLETEEKLVQNSEETLASQQRAEDHAYQERMAAEQTLASQQRAEEYQKASYENSQAAVHNSQVAARNAQRAARDAAIARRNSERY